MRCTTDTTSIATNPTRRVRQHVQTFPRPFNKSDFRAHTCFLETIPSDKNKQALMKNRWIAPFLVLLITSLLGLLVAEATVRVIEKRADGFSVAFSLAPTEDTTFDWMLVR